MHVILYTWHLKSVLFWAIHGCSQKKKWKQILAPAKQSPTSLMQKPLSTQCHNISRPIRQMNPKFQKQLHSLSGENFENWPNFERIYFWDECLAVLLTQEAFLQKRGLHTGKPWTWTQMKQELFNSYYVYSSDGWEIWWISQLEHSESLAMSLIHASVGGVEVSRMRTV